MSSSPLQTSSRYRCFTPEDDGNDDCDDPDDIIYNDEDDNDVLESGFGFERRLAMLRVSPIFSSFLRLQGC